MELHKKIRRIREDLGLTLQDVHDRGVTIFGPEKAISYRTLQRIEKGHIAKFSSMLKICCALGVPLEELLRDTHMEQRMAIRKKERLDEYTYNDKVQASVVSSPHRNLLALEMTLAPGGKTMIEQCPDTGTYEKWVYIVEGKLTCVVDNEEFALSSKDTLSFDSTQPHYFENRGHKTCLAVVVQNPKHF